MRLIHEESVRRALVSISTEMHRARDEGRTEDADALAAKLSRLAADAPASAPDARDPLTGFARVAMFDSRACEPPSSGACVDFPIRLPELEHVRRLRQLLCPVSYPSQSGPRSMRVSLRRPKQS